MEIVIRLDCLGDGKKKFCTFSVLTQNFPNMLFCVSWVHKCGTSIGGGPTLYVTNVYPQANSAASWDSVRQWRGLWACEWIVWPLRRAAGR